MYCIHIDRQYRVAYDPRRDESKKDGSNPSAVAISGCIAKNEAGIETAKAKGNASIALAIKAVARLFVY